MPLIQRLPRFYGSWWRLSGLMIAGQKRARSHSSDAVGDSTGSRTGEAPTRGSTWEAIDSIKKSKHSKHSMEQFRPPILGSAGLSPAPTTGFTINKELFRQTYDVSAARIHDPRHISKYRKALMHSRELLVLDRVSSVVDDPEQPHAQPPPGSAAVPPKAEQKESEQAGRPAAKRKCLLLQPAFSRDPETWSPELKQGVENRELELIPYQFTLGYDYWDARDILVSVLPEEFHDGIPTGFNTAGHIAHLNLRSRFAPYKYMLGQLLLDKNPNLRTVINKTDLVGTDSTFRTFPYEVLAGPDDMTVEVCENLCTYRFDYSRVYWNSKLEPEHSRLLRLFQPGQVLVDVMAGVGPFAVPAGRRGVLVWANDMNPVSFDALCYAIQRNKVGDFVRPFNEDGTEFIRRAADLVREAAAKGERVPDPSSPPVSKASAKKQQRAQGTSASSGTKPATAVQRYLPVPPTVDHYVMNLPASAITFLPRFRGLYAGCEELFEKPASAEEARDIEVREKETIETPTPLAKAAQTAKNQRFAKRDNTNNPPLPLQPWLPRLPIVHVHCFAPIDHEDEGASHRNVRDRVAEQLGVPMRLVESYEEVEEDDPLQRSATEENPVYVLDVRDVAPNKHMFCASFRLPASVAFAPR